MNKKRWLVYILIGLIFGVVDFYYQVLIQNIQINSKILLTGMVLVIWLVVVVPIAIYEAKLTRSAWRAALAAAVTWIVTVISYYLYMMVKLMFIGEPGRPELHITNRADPFYWDNVKSLLTGDIWGGMDEWLVVAVIGGIIVGYLTGFIYLKVRSKALISA